MASSVRSAGERIQCAAKEPSEVMAIGKGVDFDRVAPTEVHSRAGSDFMGRGGGSERAGASGRAFDYEFDGWMPRNL